MIYTNRSRRGTALLMSIILTSLLFVIGLSFLLSSQHDKQSIATLATSNSVGGSGGGGDGALGAVIVQISNVLVEDLFGRLPSGSLDNKLLDGAGDFTGGIPNEEQDENWDYPGPDDPWLASLEPELYDDGAGTSYLFWRQITDLWNDQFNISSATGILSGLPHYDPADRLDGSQWNGSNPAHLVTGLEISDVEPRIISDTEGTETIVEGGDWLVPDDVCKWGGRADADGDGVVDARWARIPNITGDGGVNLYAAVRIIDNSGMINANTAYRNPERKTNGATGPALVTTGGPQWDGSRLSHINFEDVINSNTDDDEIGLDQPRGNTIQNAKYGNIINVPLKSDYDKDTKYENDVATRLKNPKVYLRAAPDPSETYNPFYITDELILRYRYFLNAPLIGRIGITLDDDAFYTWPRTFSPAPGVNGKDLPYVIGESVDNWFDKVTSGPTLLNSNSGWLPVAGATLGTYNRRVFTTTYSYSRVLIPNLSTDPGGLNWDEFSNMLDISGPGFEKMPDTLVMKDTLTGWEDWSRWNDTDNSKWLYRPVSVNDIDDGISSVNDPTIEQLAAAIWLGLPDTTTYIDTLPEVTNMFLDTASGHDSRSLLAFQMAVNLVDYIDTDFEVTKLTLNNGNIIYGYEGGNPGLNITRVATSINDTGGTHYAIQLYNHSSLPINLSNWRVEVRAPSGSSIYDIPVGVISELPAGESLVLIDSDTTSSDVGFTLGEFGSIPKLTADAFVGATAFKFDPNDTIVVLGPTENNDNDYPFDSIIFDPSFSASTPSNSNTRRVYNLNDRTGNLIGSGDYQRLALNVDPTFNTTFDDSGVGVLDNPGDSSIPSTTIAIQTEPRDSGELYTVGELYNVLLVGAKDLLSGKVDYISETESWYRLSSISGTNWGRLDAALDVTGVKPYQYASHFISTFNPFNDFVDNDGNGRSDSPEKDEVDNDNDAYDSNGDGIIDINDDKFDGNDQVNPIPADDESFANYGELNELAIPGRININTAPWFVIAQLPWVTDPTLGQTNADRYKLAHSITAYRDQVNLRDSFDTISGPDFSIRPGNKGFVNVAELLEVTPPIPTVDDYYDIRKLGTNTTSDDSSANSPMFYNTVADTIADDNLERDIIYQRVSNLATVRSDTFTAYIAVRAGELGNINRYIVLFDRSNVFKPTDSPRKVAVFPVPNPL